MELLIIRHAQSTNNGLDDQRWRVVDPPLTAVGRRQAGLVAAYLADSPDHDAGPSEGEAGNGGAHAGRRITRLYTSAMHRALETAAPIGRALGIRPEAWLDVHEHGGMWLDHGAPAGIVGHPGMTRAEILARFPDAALPEGITEDGWYDPARGCEGWEAAFERGQRVAAALRGWADTDECVAIVTHGGFSSLLLRALFAVPADAMVFFHHDNTGITRVRFRANGHVSLRYLNRVAHLPAELIT